MIQEHLPILQILVPLVAVPLCVLIRRDRAAFVLALIAAWATFGISIALLLQVIENDQVVYELGGWDRTYLGLGRQPAWLDLGQLGGQSKRLGGSAFAALHCGSSGPSSRMVDGLWV